MQVMEEVFAQSGYNVVNIDATNSINESDSSPEGITFTGQDFEDAIAWAETQEFYREPFALAGQSLGAQAAVLYAANFPDKVDLLIPAAFVWLDGEVEVKNNKRTKSILENGFYEQFSKSTGKTLRIYKSFLDDLKLYKFEDKIKNITAQTCVIIGELDTEYHIENAKQLYNLLECKKKFILLQNVPHDLANTPETRQLFTKTLQDYLSEIR